MPPSPSAPPSLTAPLLDSGQRRVVVLGAAGASEDPSAWLAGELPPDTGLERLESVDRLASELDRLDRAPGCILGHWPEGLATPPLIDLVERNDSAHQVVLTYRRAAPHHVRAATEHRALDLIHAEREPASARLALLGALRRSARVHELRAEIDALTGRFADLSVRERQVLELVRLGEPSKSIGRRLAISKRTVDTHRRALIRKTGAESLGALVHSLARLECLTLEERALTAGVHRPPRRTLDPARRASNEAGGPPAAGAAGCD